MVVSVVVLIVDEEDKIGLVEIVLEGASGVEICGNCRGGGVNTFPFKNLKTFVSNTRSSVTKYEKYQN